MICFIAGTILGGIGATMVVLKINDKEIIERNDAMRDHRDRPNVIQLTSNNNGRVTYVVNSEFERTNIIKDHSCLFSNEEVDKWVNSNLMIISKNKVRVINIFYDEIDELLIEDGSITLKKVNIKR